MLRKVAGKLRYSNVVATLALCLAVGGGTAVALQGSNTVDANDLKNNVVRSKNIAPGQVAPVDVNTNVKRFSKGFDYAAAAGSGPQTVFNGGFLTLVGTCSAGSDIQFTAASARPNGTIAAVWTSLGADGGNQQSAANTHRYSRLNVGAAPVDFLLANDDRAFGTLLYDSNGENVANGKEVEIEFYTRDAGGTCTARGVGHVGQ